MTHPIPRLVIMASTSLALIGYGSTFDAAEERGEVTYEVQPLEPLSGTSSRGSAINDWGLVSGFSNLSATARRATLWLSGQVQDLGTLGGPDSNSSVAWPGQNNIGLVVGITQTDKLQTRKDGWSCRIFFPGPNNAKYTCVGFVWERDKMRRLPTLGGDNGFATSANNFRQVVGWAENTVRDSHCVNPEDVQFRAVLWDLNLDQTIELPPFGTDGSGSATAISDRGHVVGISGDCDQSVGRKTARHAVLWENGTVRDLGNLGADTWNTPTAITRNGDIVVGFANAPGADPNAPQFRAWLWTERDDIACTKLPGQDICDLGTLDNGTGTAEAWGVNERGQVVGNACSPAGFCRAFLWEKGEMKDLDQLKGSYPHLLLHATDINNRGQITGRVRISATEFEAFVASPKHRD